MVSSIKSRKMAAKSFKETKVYKLAYQQAMEIFRITQKFPNPDKY